MTIGPWPWTVGGLALAAVVLAHGFILGRLLGVSGRISALVDRVRLGAPPDDGDDMAMDELLAALQEETAAMLASEGAVATAEEPPAAVARVAERPTPARSRQRPVEHVLFFAGLVLGGLLVEHLSDVGSPTATLRGSGFARAFGGLGVPALLAGGLLVGFGTRMCGGCTSGHGLCGLARVQPGSAAATAAFFGAGIVVARVMEALWS